MFFVYRKNRVKKRIIAIATTILFVLFCYEVLLIGFNTQSHIVSVYEEPIETVKGTGIHFLGVSTFTLNNMESEQEVQELFTKNQLEVLTITALSNRLLYEQKK